jgi:hypothetical protein
MPVPPPPAVSRPARVLTKVRISPEPVIVVEAVRPLNGEDDVANVIVVPVWVCPVGPRAVIPPEEQPVQVPTVRLPNMPRLERKFVVEALVEKIFVVVAEVPVALTKEKFWSVDDAVTSKLVVVA